MRARGFDLVRFLSAGLAVACSAEPVGLENAGTISLPLAGGVYRLRPKSDPSVCLGVDAGALQNGADIAATPCSGQPEQLWWFMDRPEGTARIRNIGTNKCLRARGSAGIVQGACRYRRSKWWVGEAVPGEIQLESRRTGQCLSLAEGVSQQPCAAGDPLQTFLAGATLCAYLEQDGDCRLSTCESTAPRIATGWWHTCVLESSGNAVCYGYSVLGQSADYTGGDAVGVAAGGYHTCVLLAGGDVDCYGDPEYGQNADYTRGDAVGVAAGGVHTCVLLSSGDVDCYGIDDGSAFDFGQSRDYGFSDAVGIAAGGYHTCVLLASGNLECYGVHNGGDFDFGQSANYTGGDAVGVAAGWTHTCVLKTDGNVDCYGRDDYGQSTDYTGGDAVGVAAGRYHTCVLLSSGNVDCYGVDDAGPDDYGQSADYNGGDAQAVATGMYHTCVLKADGNVDCYGRDNHGQQQDYTAGDADTECPSCEPNCDRCTNATTCTSCSAGYSLSQGDCLPGD